MELAPRFLLPLCILGILPLACSSTNDGATNMIAPPPSGGSSAAGSGSGGSAGMATGGTGGGSAGMSGGGGAGGSGATVPPGGACKATAECQGTGFFCSTTTKVCGCSADKPDVCGAAAAAVCTSKTTDPDNCGVCGTKCDAGAVCVAGKCGAKPTDVATATGCGGGVRMATDGKNLYWTEAKNGKVRSVPIAGGTIVDIATGQLSPTQIAVDDKAVYWANQGDATAASSKVLKKALSAAPADAPVVLVTASAMDKLPALAVHKGKVYYALHTDVHQLTLDAQDKVTADIKVGISVNYDGGKMDVLGDPKGIAVNDTSVVWTTPGDRNAVESHTLTAVTNATDNKAGYGKLGKSVGALLPSGDVGIDAMYGYWANGERFDRDILTAQEGMSETITVAPDSKTITAFALNATKMFASADDGRMFTHSLTPPADPNNDNMPPVLIARDQLGVSSIVLDATKLYWITSDCSIRSIGQ